MTSLTDDLGLNLEAFLRHFPVRLAPILHHTDYRGRAFRESEIAVVTTLGHAGPMPPTGISRGLNMQKGSLTSVLRRLERLGFVARRCTPGDERSYTVALAPEGERFLAHLDRQRRHGLHDLFAAMPPEDIAAAADGLGRIAAHLTRLEEEAMAQVTDTKKPLHWYYAASPEDRREYDAYGPWVTEVKTAEDMPPRFREFYDEDGVARMLLKFPRREERRELRPGMDLYRRVMALHDDRLVLRELTSGTVESRSLAWRDIVAVSDHCDLLLGSWTLYLGDGDRVGVPYNRVSTDVMNPATDFVRTHIATGGTEPDADAAIELPATEVFFGSVLHEIGRRGPAPVVPIHYEPHDVPLGTAKGAQELATGLLIIQTPLDLVIVNRDAEIRKEDEANYASNDLFLPLDRITGYAVGSTATGGAAGPFHTIELELGGQVFRQPCRMVPERVLSVLYSRGIHRMAGA